jgi:hypothetical protein
MFFKGTKKEESGERKEESEERKEIPGTENFKSHPEVPG